MDDFNQNQEQYIKERMKQRPLNRKKLMRRTIVTALMAVIFGVLACFTFLVLEPVFTNLLYPEDEPTVVVIPEDEEEIKPEDMLLDDEDSPEVTAPVQEKEDVSPLELYKNAMGDAKVLANDVMKSMVKVIGESQDKDWFDDSYTNENVTTGLFIANNGRELLFLTETGKLNNSEDINVIFADGKKAVATIKQMDVNTDLCIIAVETGSVSKDSLDKLKPAVVANSINAASIMTPVIVVGYIYGNGETYVLGNITSNTEQISLTDSNYRIINTDIYGSSQATGVMVNLKGEVVGIVNRSLMNNEAPYMISAFGISDLKDTIERMSNGKSNPLLGVTGIDVSDEAHEEKGVPYGAYVTGIVMNSPAMKAGIQSGDIIVKMDDTEIIKYAQLTDLLMSREPESEVVLTIMRQAHDEYRDIEINIVLGENK
ncbi:MAG: S1C family serine protease [Lachnospiraceae bacterium]|nr:S1C family serine protease [Lachnospiraceae bacterium]